MLQLETIEDSYSFHSYTETSAKLIKPNRNINSGQVKADDFVEITQTTLIYKDLMELASFPAQFADFDLNHLEQLTQHDADIFLIGTGSRVIFPEKAILQHITNHKLPIDFMDTGAACRTFNILTGEYRNVATLIFFQ